MKILMLGNSQDAGNWATGAPKRHEIMRDRLAAELNEPVEVVVHDLWPNERAAGLVARWMDESNPDLIYLNVTTFPFGYESLPLRVRRLLGPLGGFFGDAGFRLADSKRWAHNAVFRTIRRWGQATIGGDTHFSTDEVVANLSEVIRVMARHEGMALVVKGPLGRNEQGTAREKRRREARRQDVHSRLQELCGRLHIDYIGRETPLWASRRAPKGSKAGDGLHANAKGHAYLAGDLYDNIHGAWMSHLAEVRGMSVRRDPVGSGEPSA